MVEIDQKSNFSQQVGLVLIIGIPASGKSSIAKKFQECQEQHENKILINVVSLDEIQKEQVDESISGWHKARDIALKKTKSFISTANQSENRQTLVIIDDTFEYASMRKAYFQLAREMEIPYAELHIKCSLQTAYERNKSRQDARQKDNLVLVTDQSITNVMSRMEKSRHPESSIEVDTEEITNFNDLGSYHELLQKIIDQAKIPSKLLENSTCELTQNDEHKLDQILRKRISNLLKEGNENLRKQGKQISQIKKTVVQQIKERKEGYESFEDLQSQALQELNILLDKL